MRQMKDSGIEWIGAIPAEWETKKCKYFASLYTGNSIKDEEKHNYEDNEDAHPYISSKDIDGDSLIVNYENGMYVKNYDGSFVCANKDDTLLCVEGGSAGRKIAYLDRKVSFVNKLCCCHPYDIVPRFLYYSILSPNYKIEFDLNLTGLIGGVSVNKLINFRVPLPPLPEQQRIAAYLDVKCAEIDRAMSRTRESIAEYKKLKQSIITEAVTGKTTHRKRSPLLCQEGQEAATFKEGMPPLNKGRGTGEAGGGVKPSGIEWIGDIPAEWEVVKLKHVLKKLERDYKLDSEVVVCSNNGEAVYRGKNNPGLISLTDNGYQGVEPGDLLIHGMDTWHGAIAVSSISGKCTSVVHVCESCQNKRFISYYLKSLAYRNLYKAFSNGVRQNTSDFRSWEKVGGILLVLPEVDEQNEISRYLDQKCSEIDGLIAKKERLIEELEKYKKSLIYECVTGKREVG